MGKCFCRLRSSLWLQFKPHHIAAGAAYLAAKFLNFELAHHQSMWQEFQTTPFILQEEWKGVEVRSRKNCIFFSSSWLLDQISLIDNGPFPHGKAVGLYNQCRFEEVKELLL
ncbi:hypothetical protein HHK36_022796 [Tetracentron sinense]|uniref:Cyclin C-terminal domain-containing protein n=1 Tax=Tetracentron sinense TaxID=13715 RepID=A0A834YNH2_TETSI|nr:hypothetical protein HHK36_022796 [Tetracentron sinense]